MFERSRSFETFGVAGLLDESCRVFYDHLFHTTHLGRISDLIMARLREKAPLEAALRAQVAFGVFQGAILQSERNAHGNFVKPVSIECGYDPLRIAISVSFIMDGDGTIDWTALGRRIEAGTVTRGQPLEGAEQWVYHLGFTSDAVVIKHQPSTRQVEISSILSLNQPLRSKCAVKVVEIGTQVDETPKAGEYTMLADLDYFNLLRTDPPQQGELPSPTGEYFAHALSVEEFKALVERLGQGQNVLDRLTGSMGVSKEELANVLSEGAGANDAQLEALAKELKMDSLKALLAASSMDPKLEAKLNEMVESVAKNFEAQKSKIAETAKKREVEFRVKETAFANTQALLKAELAERERAARHKDITIAKTREYLNQTRSELERAKQIMDQQGHRGNGASTLDQTALQAQYDKALRQVEEFKKANQQLLERLNEKAQNMAVAPGSAAETEEIKKRLEASMKMLAMSRRQTEQLTDQVEQFRREENKLKAEIEKLKAGSQKAA